MSYLTEEILNDLKFEFPGILFDYKEVNLGSQIPVFFISVDNKINLENNWRAITEFIAINFQTTIDNGFGVWNIYLFFLVKSEIGNDLKYLIENDTFSSRKIVVFDNEDLESIISEHILNTDLVIHSDKLTADTFNPNPTIWRVVNSIEPKRKKTIAHSQGLDQIIKEIKKQENEI